MKLYILLTAITCIVLPACNKQFSGPAGTSLSGSWIMTSVQDISSGAISAKPASLQGDVVITFAQNNNASGKFYGHTPSNYISQSDYQASPGHTLKILNLYITKIWETPWGAAFADNIRDAKEYNIDNSGTLTIVTIHNRLTFKKE